jgi:transposase
MDQSASIAKHVIGCDVGAKEIVIFDSLSATIARVANKRAALMAWVSGLSAAAFVVCEATGGYESELLAALAAAGVSAHRADARKVKAFIRSLGQLGKTDAIDARALARYGQERDASLARWHPPEASRAQLQALVLTRRDLVADRTAYRNRLKAPGSAHVAQHLESIVACLDAEIAAIDASINTLIKNTKDLKAMAKVLNGIKGIGATTAAALIALLPELGTTDRRRIASLAGLAPHPRQSGGMDAYRRVRGGRPEIKRVLFMAALSACRAEGPLRDAYNRLIQNGKKRMVAVIAIMRKIVVIANARIKELNQKGLTQPDELS